MIITVFEQILHRLCKSVLEFDIVRIIHAAEFTNTAVVGVQILDMLVLRI